MIRLALLLLQLHSSSLVAASGLGDWVWAAPELASAELCRAKLALQMDPSDGSFARLTLDDVEDRRTSLSRRGKRNVISGVERQWRGSDVAYTLIGALSEMEQKRLACAFLYVETHTCLRFRPKHFLDEDFVEFSADGQRCSSETIGRRGGAQRVDLARNSPCWSHGVILHELFHILGFDHEHTRADRDEYVDVHWANIPFLYQFQIEKNNPIAQKLIGPYDYESITHYAMSPQGEKPWLTAKIAPRVNNRRMGNRRLPSALDILKLNRLYNCPIPS